MAEEETSVALRHRKSLSLPSSQKHRSIKVSEVSLFKFASSWTDGEVGQDLQTRFPPGMVAPGSGVAAVLFALGFGMLSQRLWPVLSVSAGVRVMLSQISRELNRCMGLRHSWA